MEENDINSNNIKRILRTGWINMLYIIVLLSVPFIFSLNMAMSSKHARIKQEESYIDLQIGDRVFIPSLDRKGVVNKVILYEPDVEILMPNNRGTIDVVDVNKLLIKKISDTNEILSK